MWLTVMAAGTAMFAPRNRTLLIVAIACSLSTASAIYLILQMDRPFEGLIRISDIPLREAIGYLNQ